MLVNILDGIIPSLEESKQVIKFLLKELENMQLKLIEKEIEVIEMENLKQLHHKIEKSCSKNSYLNTKNIQ